MSFDRQVPNNALSPLPPDVELETKEILKKCISAHRALAMVKEAGRLIPNQEILINSIPLQEAKASSEIENIVTTGDALYRAAAVPGAVTDPQTKEVLRYRTALKRGFDRLPVKTFSMPLLTEVCEVLLDHEVQIRWFSRATISNKKTGEVVYTPPEGPDILREKLTRLEEFIQNGNPLDPLVKLALIHYQFEAIHPFEDGNGRTGRILNILYLIQQGLLDIPVLYLSRAIIGQKDEYYRLIRAVTEEEAWVEWILFMLDAVEDTSKWTHEKILSIRKLLEDTTSFCRENLPAATYSRELVEIVFVQPYCKISFLVDEGIAKRQTAGDYLRQLEKIGVLESIKVGREKVYLNPELIKVLSTP